MKFTNKGTRTYQVCRDQVCLYPAEGLPVLLADSKDSSPCEQRERAECTISSKHNLCPQQSKS